MMFADDNSTYRRAARRRSHEERRRRQRRAEILATLRRLKAQAADPTHVDQQERERRHRQLLDRYPPLF